MQIRSALVSALLQWLEWVGVADGRGCGGEVFALGMLDAGRRDVERWSGIGFGTAVDVLWLTDTNHGEK